MCFANFLRVLLEGLSFVPKQRGCTWASPRYKTGVETHRGLSLLPRRSRRMQRRNCHFRTGSQLRHLPRVRHTQADETAANHQNFSPGRTTRIRADFEGENARSKLVQVNGKCEQPHALDVRELY